MGYPAKAQKTKAGRKAMIPFGKEKVFAQFFLSYRKKVKKGVFGASSQERYSQFGVFIYRGG
jgi:hypothetical protein